MRVKTIYYKDGGGGMELQDGGVTIKAMSVGKILESEAVEEVDTPEELKKINDRLTQHVKLKREAKERQDAKDTNKEKSQ